MAIDLDSYLIFLLVMLRMSGMFLTNPIFSRRNMPSQVNMGLAFFISILLSTSLDFPALPEPDLFTFTYMVIHELAVGILAGMVLQLFLSVLIIGGEIVDMQLGLGMAKNFDPGTNASISVTATIFNIMFILTFFCTNNHLTLIYMTSQTFSIIPLGVGGFNPNSLYYIPELFSTIMIFAIKLCIPILVIEVIVTVAVGIIMRIVPQINIFVVNIQFKLLVGFFAMIILVGPFMAFFENLLVICFERIQDVWTNYLW